MADHETNAVTQLLSRLHSGDESARAQLYSIVYPELKRMARRHMSRERASHTLQPTALVHEAFLKLTASEGREVSGRLHFYAIASEYMRRILLDSARARLTQKRGSRFTPVTLSDATTPTLAHPEQFIAVNEALDRLRAMDERQARIVELRFFGGLTEEEVAKYEKISARTVKRLWKSAKVYLWAELHHHPNEPR